MSINSHEENMGIEPFVYSTLLYSTLDIYNIFTTYCRYNN